MANVPYGASSEDPNAQDDPWTKLTTITEHLEAGEPIPPDLARWLGGAIAYAGEDPAELLRRLGLKRRRGEKAGEDQNAWKVWGRRICDLEERMGREEALQAVQSETYGEYDRTTLQRWRDKFSAVRQTAINPE